MGVIINEKNYINQNVLLHEQRMGSQLTRFLDRSPTYVKYYHINNNLSMADEGLESVERMIGRNSPIRFDEISNFPIYGIEQIVIDLNLEEEGMDGSYDGGDGVLLPNTIRPLPGDFFVIDYLDKNILFQVTEIKYDTIKSNNFYKINFSLKSTNPEKILDLERQTVERYNCLTDHVGTDEVVIVKNSVLAQMKELERVYYILQQAYLDIFYQKKYNVLLFEDESGYRIYDRYQTQFINKHSLLSDPNTYRVIRLSDEDVIRHSAFAKQYKPTIYRALEEQDPSWLKHVTYSVSPVQHMESIFTLYSDRSIRSVDLINGMTTMEYLDTGFVDRILEPPVPPSRDEIDVVKPEETPNEVIVTGGSEEEEVIEEPIVPSEPVVEEPVKDPLPRVKDGEDIVFNPDMYLDEEEEEDEPHKELVPNETDTYEPIPESPKPIIIPLPATDEPLKASYENIIEDYIIQFLEGKSRNVEDLCLEELSDLARDMEESWDHFICVPILLFVLRRTIENIAQ